MAVRKCVRRFVAVLIGLAILFGCTLFFFPQVLPQELLPASQTVRHWMRELERYIWPEPEPSQDVAAFEVIRAIDGDTLLISLYGTELTSANTR